jgi:hypothetical protein
LLAYFVHATVWKFVVSRHGRDHGLSLGPYEAQIRDYLFRDRSRELAFIVAQHRLHVAGNEAPLAIPPHRQKLGPWRTWLFVIGGLQFHLKTDKREFPAAWRPFLGNANNPLLLTDGPNMDWRDVPILKPIIERMGRRP